MIENLPSSRDTANKMSTEFMPVRQERASTWGMYRAPIFLNSAHISVQRKLGSLEDVLHITTLHLID